MTQIPTTSDDFDAVQLIDGRRIDPPAGVRAYFRALTADEDAEALELIGCEFVLVAAGVRTRYFVPATAIAYLSDVLEEQR